MNMNKNVIKKAYLLGILELFILICFFLNCIMHSLSLWHAFKLFIYQLFGWLVTGCAFVHVLKLKTDSFTQMISISYIFGSMMSLINYMVFMLPGLGNLLPLACIVEAVLSLVYLYRIRSSYNTLETDTDYFFFTLLALVFYFGIVTLGVSFVNTMPNETLAGTGYYVDWPFWAGNNISFVKCFPAETFRQVGIAFKYHFFSSILVAHAALCTVTGINELSFYFSGILGGIILVASAFYFSSRILNERLLVLLSMIIVLFTDGSTVTQAWHTALCPFGFDYGYAFGMVSIAVLYEIITQDRFKGLLIPSCLLVAMTTGCKGPVGVIVVGSYGLFALYMIICRRYFRGIIGGLSWLFAFLCIYLIFIYVPEGTRENGISFIGGFGLNSIVTSSRWVSEIYRSLIGAYRIHGDWTIVKAYSIWLYVYHANKIAAVLLIIAFFKLMYDVYNKTIDVFLICLIIPCLAGIAFAVYTTQVGGSQMYFLMAMIPLASMAGLYTTDQLRTESVGKWCTVSKLNCLMIVLLCLTGMALSTYWGNVLPKIREGVAVIRNKYQESDYGDYFADGVDYEAFSWLRYNTPEDAIIATNSHKTIHGKDNSMIIGVFSQRYIWNEEKYIVDKNEASRRNGIVDHLNTDIELTIEALKKENVTYILFLITGDKAELGKQTQNLTEVFRNEHYIIYKL